MKPTSHARAQFCTDLPCQDAMISLTGDLSLRISAATSRFQAPSWKVLEIACRCPPLPLTWPAFVPTDNPTVMEYAKINYVMAQIRCFWGLSLIPSHCLSLCAQHADAAEYRREQHYPFLLQLKVQPVRATWYRVSRRSCASVRPEQCLAMASMAPGRHPTLHGNLYCQCSLQIDVICYKSHFSGCMGGGWTCVGSCTILSRVYGPMAKAHGAQVRKSSLYDVNKLYEAVLRCIIA